MNSQSNKKIPPSGGGGALRDLLAICSLTFACILVSVNMFMPPPGEVSDSAIYIFAQLLIFSATLLGVDAIVSKYVKPPDKK